MKLMLKNGQEIKGKDGHSIVFGVMKLSIITEDCKVIFVPYEEVLAVKS